MKDLLNTKDCYYEDKSKDINKQLDYWENCNRYFQCDDVALLNDILRDKNNGW